MYRDDFNHRIAMKIRLFALLSLVSRNGLGILCSLVLAGAATADDTEVFFGRGAADANARSNVLFVLDTSASMGSHDRGATGSRMDRMKQAVKKIVDGATDINVGLMRFNGVFGGGPVLYPATPLDKTVCEGQGCIQEPDSTPTATRVAAANTDDAEESVSSGGVHGATNAGNDLAFGPSQEVGLRFGDLQIPRGATVVEAYLRFTANGSHDNDSTLTVRSEATADAAPFGGNNRAISSRNWNPSGVSWEAGEWVQDATAESSNIGAVIQQVVNRDDWCSGRAMAFNITGIGEHRHAYSFESSTASNVTPPQLVVKYDVSTARSMADCGQGRYEARIAQGSDDAEQIVEGGNAYENRVLVGGIDLEMPTKHLEGYVIRQVVGLRFVNIDIPKNAKITSATIELEVLNEVDVRDAGPEVRIVGETNQRGGSPATYTSRDKDIWGSGNRIQTQNKVEWRIPARNRGTKLLTSDMKSIVQELVDQNDWQIGQAMAFRFLYHNGFNRRSFKSYETEQSRNQAPKLTITYETDWTPPPATPTPTTFDSSGTVKAREAMLKVVDDLNSVGNTPLVEAYYEAALYLRGAPVDYGKRRGVALNDDRFDKDRRYYRISHSDSYTGGRVTGDQAYRDHCDDSNPSSVNCAGEKIDENPVYKSPISHSCQANHIVLLSDGEPTGNRVQDRVKRLVGMSDSAACTDTGEQACATELATYLNGNDQSDAFSRSQTVQTHTIAFNLGGEGRNFLRRIAEEGGGGTYEASSADELTTVLESILKEVSDENTGFTAPAATVNQFNRLTHRDDVYFAMFKPEVGALWNGNLKRYRIGKDKSGEGDVLIRDRKGNPAVDTSTGYFSNTSHSYWRASDDDGQVVTAADGNDVKRGGAANQLTLADPARKVYTWTGNANAVPSTGVDLTLAAQRLHEDNTKELTAKRLGIEKVGGNKEEQEDHRRKLLKWARGVDVLDADDDGKTFDEDAGTEDVRRHIGDPMHSRPVIVNYPGSVCPGDNAEDTSADAANEGDASNAGLSVAFVTTNEGYLHAIDTCDGSELFSFVPNELLENLNVYYTNQTDDRPYGLDGFLSVWRDDKNGNFIVDGNEKAYLYFGMRRGGQHYYALDITDPAKPRLAWILTGGKKGTAKMEQVGQTWSRLSPVKVVLDGDERDVLVFGGGYDDSKDLAKNARREDDTGRGIFIVDARTGVKLWSGTGDKSGDKVFSDMRYSFAGNVRTIDIDRDGYIDQMYAADTGGQVWRFDVAQNYATTKMQINGGVIANLSDNSFLSAANHRRFYTEPDVALIEDNGRQFLTVSLGSGWRAHPLDEKVNDRFYVLRQSVVRGAPTGYGKRKRSLLSNDTWTPVTDADLIPVQGQVDPQTNDYGWYYDFASSGEKVLGTSVTFDNNVIFTTYIPSVDIVNCSPSVGGGRAYVLDVASGRASRDLDDDGKPDASIDLKHGGIPPEATILITEESGDQPNVLIGGEQIYTGIQNQTRRTFWADVSDD